MKLLISLLCLLTIACNNRETTNTIVFEDEDKKLIKDTTYISEVLSWRSEYDNKSTGRPTCEEDLVTLTVNDNYPIII